MVQFQAGVAYTPLWAHYARFTAGYTLEHWFLLGMQESNLDVNLQGLFFRAEFAF